MSKGQRDDEGFSLEDYLKEEDYVGEKEDYVGEKEDYIEDEYYKDEYYKEEYYKEDEEDGLGEGGKGYFKSERDKKENTEDLEEDLESKVDRRINKVLDYFESKQFTALQWSIAVGILMLMWGLMFMMTSAGKNIKDNAEYQEKNRSSYIAKEVAPDQYIEYEDGEIEKDLKLDEDKEYLEKNKKSYEEQKEAMGEVPEDYVAMVDGNGVLSYLSPEEYREMLNSEEGVVDSGGEDVIVEDMPIDIVPASEEVWENINYGDLSQMEEEDVYQTRGEYLYYAQRVISLHFSNQILGTDIDTDNFVLTIYENPNATYELPKDFEERMHFAFDQSGYGYEFGGQLKVAYEEGSFN